MPGDDVRDGLSFEGRYGEYKRVVDGFLRARLPAFEAEGQARLGEAMRYSAADGGKRVRGVLALAVNDLLGGDVQPALPLAGAIELIHAYSLVHDDMPCMDDDDFRRGKPSCHRAFGEAIALLAGDALLNLAFEVLLEWLAEQGPGAGRAAAAAFIARAAGADGMAGGQAIDLCAKIADESALTHLHRLKTGRLICAAVLAPAICLGAGADDYAALRQYGDGIGLAFQIKDDLLDAEGAEGAEESRSDGGAEAQKSFVGLLGRAVAERRLAAAYQSAVEALGRFGARAGFLRGAASFIVERTV